ncbi:hypothetical protein HYQ46_007282 [Verticillium longisporum]|nr:hypothetical protein HYQ46_007282 [Verticillium longisporum]
MLPVKDIRYEQQYIHRTHCYLSKLLFSPKRVNRLAIAAKIHEANGVKKLHAAGRQMKHEEQSAAQSQLSTSILSSVCSATAFVVSASSDFRAVDGQQTVLSVLLAFNDVLFQRPLRKQAVYTQPLAFTFFHMPTDMLCPLIPRPRSLKNTLAVWFRAGGALRRQSARYEAGLLHLLDVAIPFGLRRLLERPPRLRSRIRRAEFSDVKRFVGTRLVSIM